MTCREFTDFLMAYLEGGLPPGERGTFEQHMADCPSCITYLETYEETVRLGELCRDPDAPVPEDVPEALVQAVLAARGRGGS